MDYTSILDAVPWASVGRSVVQTFLLYWFLLLGVKLVGRRVFGEMGPQDMITLLLVAEACDLGLSDERAGYWGAIASVATILATAAAVERLRILRRALEEEPAVLFRDGRLEQAQMKKNMVDEDELNQVARQYGLASYDEFETLTLESDGRITGTLPSDLRGAPRSQSAPPAD